MIVTTIISCPSFFFFYPFTHPVLYSFPTRRSSDLRAADHAASGWRGGRDPGHGPGSRPDRKSTRLNSSHRCISYAVFCLKKKKKKSIYNIPSRKIHATRFLTCLQLPSSSHTDTLIV